MKNFGKTAVLLALMGGLFIAIGGALGGTGGLYIGLVLGLLMVGVSYWFSDKIAIKAARAVEVDRTQAPEYYEIVEDLAHRSRLPMPRLYIAPSDQPNAFATGRGPRRAAICVNRGLLQLMSWDEVRGVLAHELMHIRHRDVLTGSVAAAVAMAITFAARIAMWGALLGGGNRNRNANPIVMLATIILAPLAAMLIQMAISRSREYHADAAAARLLADGEPLARALERLDAYAGRIPAQVDPSQASNYIVNPLKGSRDQFVSWFSTHPPVAQRVERLRGRDWSR